jgi:hypothetical protein
MSSTNRGKAKRPEHDYYTTPIKPIMDFLDAFDREVTAIDPSWYVLDPCAGGDANTLMPYPAALELKGFTGRVDTIDIRADSPAQYKDDYLQHHLQDFPDLIITNPPFYLAEEFVGKALADVEPGGYVVMLMRLNWFGSAKRFQFFQKNMPNYCFIHSKRMSFVPGGKTDSIEYAHMVWHDNGQDNNCCKTFVI